MTKFSIIIPVYNTQETIDECLNSVINQTYSDLEIICINDCSTDNSLEILNKFAQKDNRIKIINQTKNSGQGVARNIALDKATGDYILFLDSDDTYEFDTCEKLNNEIKRTNAKVIQYNYRKVTNKEKKEHNFSEYLKHKFKYDINQKQYYNWHNIQKGFFKKNIYFTWNKIYNIKFIRDNNIKFAENRNSEDHIFTFKVLLLADKIHYLNETFYNYNYRENSASNIISEKNFCILDNLKLLKDFLEEKNLFTILRKEFNEYCLNILVWNFNFIPLSSKKLYKNEAKKYLNLNYYIKFLYQISFLKNFSRNIISIKNKYENGQKYKVLTVFYKEIILSKK